MDSLRGLNVKASYDNELGAVKFYLPQRLPFSAASLRGTLTAIEPFADDNEVTATFMPRSGMVITAALTGDTPSTVIEQMFVEGVPLKATPTEHDERIDLLHVDIDSLETMVDPAQVLTTIQLKQFLRRLEVTEEHSALCGSDLTNMWRLTLREGGYFALGTAHNYRPALSAAALLDILRPKYGTRSVEVVELIKSATEEGKVPTATVRIYIKGVLFDSVFHEMADRLRDNLPAGFSHVAVGRTGSFLQMTYTGGACNIAHPHELGVAMTQLLRPVFRIISASPADGCVLRVFYPNSPDFVPMTTVQTSVSHYLTLVSDR